MAEVEFFYDYISPYSYLAFSQRTQLEDAGAELIHRPFFLGGLLAGLRSTPPIDRPGHARAGYLKTDVARWAKRYGLPMVFHPRFPFNTLPLLRGALLAAEEGKIEAYSQRCFDAIWVESLDADDPDIGRRLAEEAGLDGQQWLEATQKLENKAQIKANTVEANTRGAFGAPTFFLGDEMIFGNDRLSFLIEMLTAGSK